MDVKQLALQSYGPQLSFMPMWGEIHAVGVEIDTPNPGRTVAPRAVSQIISLFIYRYATPPVSSHTERGWTSNNLHYSRMARTHKQARMDRSRRNASLIVVVVRRFVLFFTVLFCKVCNKPKISSSSVDARSSACDASASTTTGDLLVVHRSSSTPNNAGLRNPSVMASQVALRSFRLRVVWV